MIIMMINILRPNRFNEIMGQEQIKKCLEISTKSASSRQTCLEHILFDGFSGGGKTTFANVIANEMGAVIQTANGSQLRSINRLLPFLARITEHSIFFIDEIHRMTRMVEEFLYPVMEDFFFTLNDDEDVEQTQVPKFTLIGATTTAGNLSTPFLNRFSICHHLIEYSENEIVELLKINSRKLFQQRQLKDNILLELAKRSRGVPRVANNLLKWLRDYTLSNSISPDLLTVQSTIQAMTMIGVNDMGLDNNDRKYINVLKAYNGPAGVKTLSLLADIDERTVIEQIEPFLLRRGIIKKTPKGRVLVRLNP